MKNEKMKDTASAFELMAKVFGGIAIGCGMVCVIFAILVPVLGERVFVPDSVTLDLDFLKFHLNEEYQTVTGAVKLYAVSALLNSAVLCFLLGYIARLLRTLFIPMKEGRPFGENAPAVLRRIAVSILIGGGLAAVLGVVERLLLMRAYPVEEIFSGAAITKIEYAFTADFTFILLAGVVFLLSYIFSYGQALQRESDETL